MSLTSSRAPSRSGLLETWFPAILFALPVNGVDCVAVSVAGVKSAHCALKQLQLSVLCSGLEAVMHPICVVFRLLIDHFGHKASASTHATCAESYATFVEMV
jgi:hypothetical protein